MLAIALRGLGVGGYVGTTKGGWYLASRSNGRLSIALI